MVLHRHVCIVFLPNPPIAILELHYCTRDDEGPYFCINQNNNIDNDLCCSSNEFPNHLALLTMVKLFYEKIQLNDNTLMSRTRE